MRRGELKSISVMWEGKAIFSHYELSIIATASRKGMCDIEVIIDYLMTLLHFNKASQDETAT
jgi:hypothetical protein